MSKIRFFVPLSLMAIFFCGCTTVPPGKSPSNQQQIIASVEPAAIQTVATAAVGVAVSKGISASQIAIVAYQLQKFVSGSNITVGAVTTEIQSLEQKANLNTDQVVAIAGVRAIVDGLISSYIANGVISPSATTTLDAFLNDVIMAAEMLGSPFPGGTVTPGAPAAQANAPTADMGPPAPSPTSSSAWKSLESPQLVGAATSTLIVGALQAWGHLTVAAPAAAAITVLATFLAGWLSTL